MREGDRKEACGLGLGTPRHKLLKVASKSPRIKIPWAWLSLKVSVILIGKGCSSPISAASLRAGDPRDTRVSGQHHSQHTSQQSRAPGTQEGKNLAQLLLPPPDLLRLLGLQRHSLAILQLHWVPLSPQARCLMLHKQLTEITTREEHV